MDGVYMLAQNVVKDCTTAHLHMDLYACMGGVREREREREGRERQMTDGTVSKNSDLKLHLLLEQLNILYDQELWQLCKWYSI